MPLVKKEKGIGKRRKQQSYFHAIVNTDITISGLGKKFSARLKTVTGTSVVAIPASPNHSLHLREKSLLSHSFYLTHANCF